MNEKKHPNRGAFFIGGEGGTRTLAPVTRPTPLAGAPRHQLEYFSVYKPNAVSKRLVYSISPFEVWRRGRDSNPWLFRVTGFQDQLHKPLGHLSVSTTVLILSFLMADVNTKNQLRAKKSIKFPTPEADPAVGGAKFLHRHGAALLPHGIPKPHRRIPIRHYAPSRHPH